MCSLRSRRPCHPLPSRLARGTSCLPPRFPRPEFPLPDTRALSPWPSQKLTRKSKSSDLADGGDVD